MGRLVVRRLLLTVPTILGVAVLVFAFLHLVPGDPVEIMLGESAAPAQVEALRHDLGLDRPLLAQLAGFFQRAVRGDLGYSIAFRAPVGELIRSRYPATVALATTALLLAIAAGIPLGVVAAVRRGSALDRGIRLLSLLGVCVPGVVLGPLLMLVCSIRLGWLPVSGRGGVNHLVLPAVTLALGMIGILVRLTRTSTLVALDAEHVRTARAKGASALRVILRHVLPAALLPVVTVVGLQTGALLTGAVIAETIFAWPGVGRLVVQAIAARDYPLVQGCVLTIGMTYVAVNTLTDLLHVVLDPRLRNDA
jgi:peptide/nickel transport system permease protein